MKKSYRDVITKGLIFKKIPFKESSLILEIFSNRFGKISVIAKGIRKEKNKNIGLIEVLNELELVLYKKPESQWYILKSASLIKPHLFNVKFQNNVLMQAGIEIYRQLKIPKEDYILLYDLIIKYIEYLKKVDSNGIAIFWRFLFKVFIVLGINIDIKKCIHCNHEKTNFFAYYPQKNGFICSDCYLPVFDSFIFKISEETSEIISNLNKIGAFLDKITISEKTINQINNIFLTHLSEQFNKKFYLNTLEMY